MFDMSPKSGDESTAKSSREKGCLANFRQVRNDR